MGGVAGWVHGGDVCGGGRGECVRICVGGGGG